MNRIKLWPHATIVLVVVALVAGLGVYLWMNHEQTASAASLPYAARIQRVDGEVAFSDNRAGADGTQDWTAATANQPFSEGDRIYTRDNARTSVAFSGRNFARLDPNTSLDCVSLGDRRTQLALRDGSAMFDVGYLQPNETFEVATPNGAINFDQPGLYNVGFDRNGGVLVSVLSGLASVVGPGGSSQINKGEMLTLLSQAASEVALSRLNPQDAGRQVDDYYRYQYPNSYDGRYSNYDAYLSEPNYYDPYRRNASYQYSSSYIPGLNDLDAYGDWQNVDGYGNAWRPRVASGWVPYQQGQWINNYPYGPTWVSSETWGYAPYHYGRWANVGNQWYWIPDGVNTTPTYSPALVAFVSLDNANQIGWVPLGPGDNYAPRYYDENWQPRYLSQTNVSPARLFNLAIPGAVTVVPVDAWGRAIDPRSVRQIDQQRLVSVRSTLDPLTLTPLRNAVVHSAWGRGKIDLPPGIAKKLDGTRVFVGSDIRESPFRRDLAKSMRVERVSDNARNQTLKVRDERTAVQQADNSRKQEGDRKQQADAKRETDLKTIEAVRGNKDAQRQTRQVEQQQRKETRTQAQAPAQQKATRAQAPAQQKVTRAQQPAQQKATRAQAPAQQKPARAQQPAQQPQQKAQRKTQQQAQGERVANPATKPPSKGAAKQTAKPKPPAQPDGQGKDESGKGKVKKP
jgi:FecR protein